MPDKARLLRESIREYVDRMRLKGRSKKTIESAEWVLNKSITTYPMRDSSMMPG